MYIEICIFPQAIACIEGKYGNYHLEAGDAQSNVYPANSAVLITGASSGLALRPAEL